MPYSGKSRRQIKEHILTTQIEIKDSEIPFNWSKNAADFFNKASLL